MIISQEITDLFGSVSRYFSVLIVYLFLSLCSQIGVSDSRLVTRDNKSQMFPGFTELV